MSQRNSRACEIMGNESNLSVDEFGYISKKARMAMREENYANFKTMLIEHAKKSNYALSANGALEYASTGSALVDFNARATEFRNAAKCVIVRAAKKAYAENPVDFVKLMFQTGDIRGGKGERHAFNICMDWLVAVHPEVADEILALIPEYTRWDYLVRQTISDDEMVSAHATKLVSEQLQADIQAVAQAKSAGKVNISLLAKWMPSLQTRKGEDKKVVRHLLKSFKMSEREYRKTLSMLRKYLNIIEKSLSAKDYDAIDMEKLSSKQQLKYTKCFKRVMAKKRHEYIMAVLRGEKKMNTSVINPIEVVHEYYRKNHGNWCDVRFDEDMEALWALMPDKTSGNGNTLVVRDGSGSMTDRIGLGSKATMLEAATAIAIYCADHMTGAFHDTFITFSSKPEVVDLSGCNTLADKLSLMDNYDDCSNTDLEATFDLVLNTAVSNGLSQEEIPAYMLVLSDMEFDEARGAYNWGFADNRDRNTLFSDIRSKWEAAGYTMPTLVFWQLNGARTIYPEIDAENGVIYLSGFSTNELELVMAGKYEEIAEVEEEVEEVDEATGEIKTVVKTRTEKRILSLEEQLKLKLSNERYDAVEEAVKRGILRETA